MKKKISRKHFYYRITEGGYLWMEMSSELKQASDEMFLELHHIFDLEGCAVFVTKGSSTISKQNVFIGLNSCFKITHIDSIDKNILLNILNRLKYHFYHLLKQQ